MGPGEHRPRDEQYWTRPWATQLFAGDLLEAIPFGDQPTTIVTPDSGEASGKHFVGEVVFGFGVLLTPTCDMVDQHRGGAIGHPFRTIAPVVPFATVLAQTAALEASEKLLRSRDAIGPYMYLPPLPDVLENECVACLFRPSTVGDDLLRDPPRRIAQLQPEARRHLKTKLAAYWGRARVAADDLPLHERDEDAVRSEAWPPSAYDPDAPRL